MNIPEWSNYYPELKNASNAHKKAYQYLTENWEQGKKVDLDDSRSSYLFYYCYKLNDQFLVKRTKTELKRVSSKYSKLLKMYGEDFPKLNYYATNWMMQMSKVIDNEEVGAKWLNYYLEHMSDDRKNLNDLGTLLYKDEKEYIPTKYFADIFPIKSKLSPFGQSFGDEIRQFIEQKLDLDFEKHHQNYIARFSKESKARFTIPTTDTVAEELVSPYDIVDSHIFKLDKSSVRRFIKDSENEWRKSNHLPEIGRGWVHESQLYEELKRTFYFLDVEMHARLEFLGMQHYDIYFPKYKIACEYQGEQHFKPVSYFGGKTSLESNKERDARKKRISKFNNVKLIEVMPDYNLKNLVRKISKFIGIEPPEAQYVDTKDLPGIDKLSKYRKRK